MQRLFENLGDQKAADMMDAPDLTAALLAGIDVRDDWGKDQLHVSDLSVVLGEDGKCPRQLWLRVHGYPHAAPTLGKMLMFDNGKGIHERVVPMLERGLKGTGWRIEHVELSLKGLLPDGLESGRLDTVLRSKTGRCLVLDYKSIRGNAFHYLDAPKPAHRLQVQTYIQAFDADGGVILYLDREGQNGAMQFPIERDDAAVLAALKGARATVNGLEPPPILSPVVQINENKGPDSIKVGRPWQCDYCEFSDVSCESALPHHLRDMGIVAKRTKDGKLIPMAESEEVMEMVRKLLGEKLLGAA